MLHARRVSPKEARRPQIPGRRPRYREPICGQGVDGVVKAIINRTDGVRLQVDYGKDETALVYLWQAPGRLAAHFPRIECWRCPTLEQVFLLPSSSD